MYTFQICGAVFGLAVAWGIQYYYTMRETKEEDKKIRNEIEAIRQQAKNSNK